MPNQDLIDCMYAEKALHDNEIVNLQSSIEGANNQIVQLNANINQVNFYIDECNTKINDLTSINQKFDQIIAILESQ